MHWRFGMEASHFCVGCGDFFRQLLSQNQRQSQDQPFGFYPSYTQRIYRPFWVVTYIRCISLSPTVYVCDTDKWLVLSREFKGGFV